MLFHAIVNAGCSGCITPSEKQA